MDSVSVSVDLSDILLCTALHSTQGGLERGLNLSKSGKECIHLMLQIGVVCLDFEEVGLHLLLELLLGHVQHLLKLLHHVVLLINFLS